MRRSILWVAPAVAAALLLSGCGPVNAGSAARDQVEAALEAEFGEHIEELRISSTNDLPFTGRAFGSVVLLPETSPEVFAEVVAFVASFQPSSASFDGSGVQANGVGVCVGDPQADRKLELRDALHAAGASLAGEWSCATRATDDALPYAGTAADLDADADLLRSIELPSGLRLEGSLSEPDGRVSVAIDRLPDTVGETLAAVGAAAEIAQFALEDGVLTIAIAPTADPAPVQAAADAAAGRDLRPRVVLGSLDPAEQARFEELAPLLDALREIPGVDGVEAASTGVTLRTLDPRQVTAVHDAAVAHPELADLALTILVGDGTAATGALEYSRPRGAQSDSIDAFAALAVDPGVADLTVREAAVGGDRWVVVELTGELADMVRLKPVLPIGAPAQLSSATSGETVRLTIADPLAPDDLDDVAGTVDREALADAWNAAP
ncbi:hypothetical protein [Agrococcus citreus]|uniref:Uncharacterized protein n=1 Tax=Agrococcus citreus TaxID=84643 RepID=A0ABP4JME0_9MICO